MKLIVLGKNIKQGLDIVSHITSSIKTNLPILNNVLIEAEKGLIKLTTTNLEIAIKTEIQGKVLEKGKITVPAKTLNDYISFINKDETIDFKSENNDLILKTKNSESKIKGLSSEEFPIIPKIEKDKKYILKAKDFKKALEQTLFTVSPSEIRTELSGLLLYFNSPSLGKLTITGTDSYRLAEKIINLDENSDQKKEKLIVPLKTLQEILRLLNKNYDNLEIYPSENQILFIYNQTEIISRLVSGQYPEYQPIIPTKFQTKALISKDEFIKSIKQTSLFSQIGINDIVLSFNKNSLTLSSASDTLGESHTKIKAEIEGKENTIIFNFRYLLDGLLVLDGQEVYLMINDQSQPGLLKEKDQEDYLYLIMPIKK